MQHPAMNRTRRIASSGGTGAAISDRELERHAHLALAYFMAEPRVLLTSGIPNKLSRAFLYTLPRRLHYKQGFRHMCKVGALATSACIARNDLL